MSIQFNGAEIGSVYCGENSIGEIYHGGELIYSSGVKLTINTTPADAVVSFDVGKISGYQTKVKKGTVVNYTISKDGYYSVSGSLTVTKNKVIDIVLEQIYYNDGQTIYESASGGDLTTLNLKTSGRYQVICIGGGGGASEWVSGSGRIHCRSSGGSGSGFDCIFQLIKGDYVVNVGGGGAGKYFPGAGSLPGKVDDGGNSRFGDSYAYGGGGATTAYGPVLIGGAAGAVPTLTYTVISSTLNRAGNAGVTANNSTNLSGGASIYGYYGKGGDAVGNASVVNGNAGYVKVIFLGR